MLKITHQLSLSTRAAGLRGESGTTSAHHSQHRKDLTWFLRKAGLLELLVAVFGMAVTSGPIKGRSDSEGGIVATVIKRSSVNEMDCLAVCKI